MDALVVLIVLIVVLFVVFKLGLFNPIVELAAVATRESTAYNREHKSRVAKRYETMATNVDVVKVNENIAKIDMLKFD